MSIYQRAFESASRPSEWVKDDEGVRRIPSRTSGPPEYLPHSLLKSNGSQETSSTHGVTQESSTFSPPGARVDTDPSTLSSIGAVRGEEDEVWKHRKVGAGREHDRHGSPAMSWSSGTPTPPRLSPGRSASDLMAGVGEGVSEMDHDYPFGRLEEPSDEYQNQFMQYRCQQTLGKGTFLYPATIVG